MDRAGGGVCPVCGYNGIKIDAILSGCSRCLHIFQTDLKAGCAYDAGYLQTYLDHSSCDSMSAARVGIVLGTLDLPPGARILDIGYANGAFLKAMERIGYDVYGMDLHGQDMGIREVGYDTPLVYDLVCFFDSLEHFEDIDLPLQLQTRHVVVSLPMRPAFFPEKAKLWKHFKPGEHLHYFCPESLDAYMRRWGLTRLLSHGHPEDVVRGRLNAEGRSFPNIYTAIYGR